MTAPSRRERLRAATIAEIKQAARRRLVDHGPAAISLRAIAREMGMTAPALYRYFPSLEALVTELVADLLDEMTDSMEAARDAEPEGDIRARLYAVTRAFREWAITHRPEFTLIFANPLPSLGHPNTRRDPRQPDCLAGTRYGDVFARLFVELWQRRPFPVPSREELPPGLLAQLDRYRELTGTPLPTGALYVFLSCWVRLYGMVALEVFGHLHFALDEIEPMFEAEVARLARRLHLDPPATIR